MTLDIVMAALDELKEYTNDHGKAKIMGIKVGVRAMMQQRPIVIKPIANAELLASKE